MRLAGPAGRERARGRRGGVARGGARRQLLPPRRPRGDPGARLPRAGGERGGPRRAGPGAGRRARPPGHLRAADRGGGGQERRGGRRPARDGPRGAPRPRPRDRRAAPPARAMASRRWHWRWWCRLRCSPPSRPSTFCGVPLDVISLAGLALAAGMLVDSSIVVLEAIETARAQRQSEPETPEVAGTRQIAKPVIAGFFTTAVVFLPLLYLQGLARAFFGAQAFAIVASLAASLLFSLTVTPVLARDARRPGPAAGRTPGRALYLRLLDRFLARPALPVTAALAATAVALLAALFLPHELVPAAPTRDLVVRYRLAPDLAPEAARPPGRGRRGPGGGGPEGIARRTARRAARDGRDISRQCRGERTDRTLRFPDAASAARAQGSCAAPSPGCRGSRCGSRRGRAPRGGDREAAGRRLEVVASAATPERAEALARRAADRLRGAAGLREATPPPRARPRGRSLLAWDVPRLAALGADRDRLEEQVREALADQESGRVRILGTQPEIVVLPTAQEDPALLPVVVTASAAGAASPGGTAGVYPLGALARLRRRGPVRRRLGTGGRAAGRAPRLRERRPREEWARAAGPGGAAARGGAGGGRGGLPRRPGAGAAARLRPAPAGARALSPPRLPGRRRPLRVAADPPGGDDHGAGRPRRRARPPGAGRADPQHPFLPGADPARRDRGQQRHRAGPSDRGSPQRRLAPRHGGPPGRRRSATGRS